MTLRPFLTIVTRHMCERNDMLLTNRASLGEQTDQDFEQLIITDDLRRGVAWSYTNLQNYTRQINGLYVFLLDDDDMLAVPDFVSSLKRCAVENDYPDVIMMRMQHEPDRVLPDDRHWKQNPELGYIGCSAYAVWRGVWMQHVRDFQPVYHGDYTFIDTVYHSGVSVVWLDRIMTRTQNGHHHGQPA